MKSFAVLFVVTFFLPSCADRSTVLDGPSSRARVYSNGKADDVTPEDGTFDPSSGIGCIFGDHLVSIARARDLKVSDPLVISVGSVDSLSEIQKLQIIDDAKKFGGEILSIEEAVERADEAQIDFRTIKDTAHDREFNMFVYFAGDNASGSIYYLSLIHI